MKYTLLILLFILSGCDNSAQLEKAPIYESNTSSSVAIDPNSPSYLQFEPKKEASSSTAQYSSKENLADSVNTGSTSSNYFKPVFQTILSNEENIKVSKNGFNLSLVDAGLIQGLAYSCGSIKSYSTSKGIVSCEKLPLTLSIGNIHIATLTSFPYFTKKDYTLFTQEMLGVFRGATSHKEVLRLSHLFQALDGDQNPNNGIQLSENNILILNRHFYEKTTFSNISDQELNTFYQLVDANREKTVNYISTFNLNLEDVSDSLTEATLKEYKTIQP